MGGGVEGLGFWVVGFRFRFFFGVGGEVEGLGFWVVGFRFRV